MYVRMDDKLRSIHRNVKTIGEALSSEDFDNLKESIKNANDEDLAPNKTINGLKILKVVNHHKAGSITTNILVEV